MAAADQAVAARHIGPAAPVARPRRPAGAEIVAGGSVEEIAGRAAGREREAAAEHGRLLIEAADAERNIGGTDAAVGRHRGEAVAGLAEARVRQRAGPID